MRFSLFSELISLIGVFALVGLWIGILIVYGSCGDPEMMSSQQDLVPAVRYPYVDVSLLKKDNGELCQTDPQCKSGICDKSGEIGICCNRVCYSPYSCHCLGSNGEDSIGGRCVPPEQCM